MFEFFTVPTEEYNESNEEFIQLRAFFDIYENVEANEITLNYINGLKDSAENSDIMVYDPDQIVDLGLLLPYFAPMAHQAERILRSDYLIESDPAPITQQAEYTLSPNTYTIQPMATINIQPAVNYATTYATKPNEPAYNYFSHGDCANFASQILEASGVKQIVYDSKASGWWHKTNPHSHSNSWSMADTFARYMGVTYKTKIHFDFTRNIQRGDFIGADWTSDGNWDHTAFVTEWQNFLGSWGYYDYKVAQHTINYHAWTTTSTNNWENNSDGRTYARIRR